MAEIDAEELGRRIGYVRAVTATLVLSPELEDGLSAVLAAAEAHLASLRAPKGELEEARADSLLKYSLLKYPEQAELWYAINNYAEACGARTSKHTASIARQNAVAAVESIIRAALSRARGEGA